MSTPPSNWLLPAPQSQNRTMVLDVDRRCDLARVFLCSQTSTTTATKKKDPIFGIRDGVLLSTLCASVILHLAHCINISSNNSCGRHMRYLRFVI